MKFYEGRITEATKLLSDKWVTVGRTDNPAVNANMAANHIYFDVALNEGLKLIESTEDSHKFNELVNDILVANIGTLFGGVDFTLPIDKVLDGLMMRDEDREFCNIELFFEEITDAIAKENLDFTIYYLWVDSSSERVALEHPGYGSWMDIYFGNEEERDAMYEKHKGDL